MKYQKMSKTHPNQLQRLRRVCHIQHINHIMVIPTFDDSFFQFYLGSGATITRR